MIYLIYIPLALAPSLIWLTFYLKKDRLAESKAAILKIFFFGMVIALAAAAVEVGISKSFSFFQEENLQISGFFTLFLYNFFGIALVEEILKYLVVRKAVLNNPEFDEPVDAMVYMITVALGFAALENILILIPSQGILTFENFSEMAGTAFLRFLGATFLHALASGLLGYYAALAIYDTKNHTKLIAKGLLIATLLHALYNFSIMESSNSLLFLLTPIIILIALAIFVSRGFNELKKRASVCQIK